MATMLPPYPCPSKAISFPCLSLIEDVAELFKTHMLVTVNVSLLCEANLFRIKSFHDPHQAPNPLAPGRKGEASEAGEPTGLLQRVLFWSLENF